jgi:hypothetical protein
VLQEENQIGDAEAAGLGLDVRHAVWRRC